MGQTNKDLAEDEFYALGGTSDKMHNRLDTYIREQRTVDEPPDITHNNFHLRAGLLRNEAHQYRDYVLYSAYSTEDYKDNLDDIAVKGRVKFVTNVLQKTGTFVLGSMPFADRKKYVSPVMENPTWLEIALLANDMINCTGDDHHIYLEGVRPSKSKFALDEKSFVQVYEFNMGS